MDDNAAREKILVLGEGGHAKSLVDAIEASDIYEIAGYVTKFGQGETGYRGYRIIGSDEQLRELFESGIRCACVGIGFLGRGNVRNILYARLKQIGYRLPVITDPSAIMAKDVRIGEGAFVGKGAVINSDARIGKMAIVNTAAIVEHDCEVGDFCHIAVSGVICGAAHVGKNVFVGANATVIQGIHIGDGAVIGAGSVIVRDVAENVKFVKGIGSVNGEMKEAVWKTC